ncbi:Oligosaccharyltransferase subunit Ribophorin II-domain-containing protein [Pisolithus orientalis]|uniref:Oligosaccharyltransferase subunit Ribophorin II-domain-containing protein n=1 Tax=Pisolithus orientalis TaxID=936130 RepID=UPI0022256454|nr:Oligosaccharyltransferase subunit Ribophorin II-domain-containing protein [Pisolithus orientalis]KAI6020002.1 Oligosaccharyltransferase subunit Ribophorin II-domain-containing protein [Pisolithus orientalis]
MVPRIALHFTWLLLAVCVHAGSLSLQNPRFTITSSTAAQLRADTLSLTEKPEPLKLEPSDTLKLTFQITEKSEGKGVQPHQTFLRFYDSVSGEEGIQPVRVTPGGKAKFELNMARPPASLPPTTDHPLEVSLILGSFVHEPTTFDLFDLYVPSSYTPAPHPDEAKFHELPLIHHTFRPEQKLPPKFVSAVFAALVLSPWLVLLGLWSKIGVRVPHLFSPRIIPFTVLLGAFEALLCWYWVDLKLGQVLLYGGILAVPTIFAGKTALAATGEWRTGQN